MQSLIPYPSTFKDCKVVSVPMGEDSVVGFHAFYKRIGKLGENGGVISGGKCGSVHDGESVTVFCGGVNNFFFFFFNLFSNDFHRPIVFCGDFIRQLFQLCGIASNEIFSKHVDQFVFCVVDVKEAFHDGESVECFCALVNKFFLFFWRNLKFLRFDDFITIHKFRMKRASTKEANVSFSVVFKVHFPICPVAVYTVSDRNKVDIGNISGIELK